ncbi:MAG: 50S ribosomal protein L17 [Cyclobacteriaceae bacterium]|nr:50S ribosomal protein L17 [Cyclobacteriaceae bacterium HetDA_MAG_MS6]
MRHGKKFNHLGRTASHRSAMLSNMASSLIIHKRINTTVAKAKALKKYVEPLITKAKTDSTHARRVVFSYLQDKDSVTELFGPVADKVSSRPGGYTRILKTGSRLGDNAEMCIMELVDFNELMLEAAKPAKAKTRRSRRGKGAGKSEETNVKAEEATSEVEVAEVAAEETETPVEEIVEEVTEVEASTEESVETPTEEPQKEEESSTEEGEKKND